MTGPGTDPLHVVALALYGLGVVVVVVSSWLALLPRRPLDRLHLISPGTSLGAPLVGLGIALENGWSLAAAEALLIAALLAFTGPALVASTGRVVAEREGVLAEKEPE